MASLLIGIYFLVLGIVTLTDSKRLMPSKVRDMEAAKRKDYRRKTELYRLAFSVICFAMFAVRVAIPGSDTELWCLAVLGIPALLVCLYVIYLEREVFHS